MGFDGNFIAFNLRRWMEKGPNQHKDPRIQGYKHTKTHIYNLQDNERSEKSYIERRVNFCSISDKSFNFLGNFHKRSESQWWKQSSQFKFFALEKMRNEKWMKDIGSGIPNRKLDQQRKDENATNLCFFSFTWMHFFTQFIDSFISWSIYFVSHLKGYQMDIVPIFFLLHEFHELLFQNF